MDVVKSSIEWIRKENILALPLLLNNRIKWLFVCLLLVSLSCFSKPYSIEDSRTDATSHGLYEIREEAIKFVKQENAKHDSDWTAMEPNLKIMVPRCEVPLKTMWVPKDRGLSNKSVWVICEKTAKQSWKAGGKWEVSVPVMRDYIENRRRTDAVTHGLYEIRKEAREFVMQENQKNWVDWEARADQGLVSRGHRVDWVVRDPDLKYVVSRCVVPLKTKWAPKNKNVWVMCEKAVNNESWKVPLPVSRR